MYEGTQMTGTYVNVSVEVNFVGNGPTEWPTVVILRRPSMSSR